MKSKCMASAYLDYQASTPVLPEALEAMRPFWGDIFATPSSLHQQGLHARNALDRAREQVAALIQAESPEEIIFTSGGTEAANLAVKGIAFANQRRGRHLVVSATEHPSVMRSVEFLERLGFSSTKVPVDFEGRIHPEAVREALTEQTVLICVHHVNHDIGTIQDIQRIAALAADCRVPLFTDAVASAGWLSIDVKTLGVPLLSLAPHRFYGPKGVGVLYRNRRARIEALQHGGNQEYDRRAGTENVQAIVGAGVAAEVASRELQSRGEHTARLQKMLWERLEASIPFVRLNGPMPGPHRIGNNLNISVEFVEGEGLTLMCDVQGIAVASGASCVSKSLKASPVLQAIGLDKSLAQANIILSLGKDNNEEEMNYFLETFPKIVAKLRSVSPLWEDYQNGRVDSLIHPRS
jgi:cysteine desulfurase